MHVFFNRKLAVHLAKTKLALYERIVSLIKNFVSSLYNMAIFQKQLLVFQAQIWLLKLSLGRGFHEKLALGLQNCRLEVMEYFIKTKICIFFYVKNDQEKHKYTNPPYLAVFGTQKMTANLETLNLEAILCSKRCKWVQNFSKRPLFGIF